MYAYHPLKCAHRHSSNRVAQCTNASCVIISFMVVVCYVSKLPYLPSLPIYLYSKDTIYGIVENHRRQNPTQSQTFSDNRGKSSPRVGAHEWPTMCRNASAHQLGIWKAPKCRTWKRSFSVCARGSMTVLESTRHRVRCHFLLTTVPTLFSQSPQSR